MVKEERGDHGLVGTYCGPSALMHTVEDVYDYLDDQGKSHRLQDELLEHHSRRFDKLMSFSVRPDFIAAGASGLIAGGPRWRFAGCGPSAWRRSERRAVMAG